MILSLSTLNYLENPKSMKKLVVQICIQFNSKLLLWRHSDKRERIVGRRRKLWRSHAKRQHRAPPDQGQKKKFQLFFILVILGFILDFCFN